MVLMGKLITCHYDNQMLLRGFDNLTTVEKNGLILDLAESRDIPVTDIDKEYLLQHHKDLKIQQFSNICEDEILNGFISQTNGNKYRTNRDDQLNLIGKFLSVDRMPDLETVMWKAENLGAQVPHTREEFIAIYDEAFLHKEKKLYKLHLLREQVKACKTDAEVHQLTW